MDNNTPLTKKRDNYASRFGMLMVLIGGSVGLGNVWKFPYMTGANGGAAFLLVYLFVILLFGIPMIVLEFAIARKTHKPVVEAIKEISPGKKWHWIGYFGVLFSVLVYAEYATVSGWSLAYTVKAVTGEFMGQTPDAIVGSFLGFISNGPVVFMWAIAILVISAVVVIFGIQNGLEKISKVLMPMLIVCLAIIAVRALTLPGAGEGVKFYLVPDFSKINGGVLLAAFGQAFFSLGIGLGATATLGSYQDSDTNIFSDACFIAGGDTMVALLAGFIVFPCVFAYGMTPDSGPTLVFITLNSVFAQMPGGQLFGSLFYLLLLLAIFTSTFTILQCIVGFMESTWKMGKVKAVLLATLGGLAIAIPYMLGFGVLGGVQIFGMPITDLCDLLLNVATPLGALLFSIYVGWIWGADKAADVINFKKPAIRKLWIVLVKFVSPIIILGVLISGI